MKTLLKRMSAGLLALFMVLSLLFAGLPTDIFAATGTLIYNTGTRHDYDVTLSAQAQAYYTGNYTWAKLSSLQGGTTSCLSTDNPLFEALHDLMASTMTNSVSYSSLPTYWAKTDASKSVKNYMLFYTDIAGPDGNMNREHVWPKSHGSFYEKNAGSDLHHLRPTNGGVNSSRGNLIMGNVKGKSGASTYPYGGKTVLYKTSSLCEVNDNIKGDVARILLYVWCRWEEPNLFMNSSSKSTNSSDGGSKNKNDGGKVIESLDTLLEWCETDPVDTWEMNRNDQVENVQGNRNVFIDYPEFAWLVFGQDVPNDLVSPSGNSGTTSNPGGTVTPPVTTPPATNPPVTNPPVTNPPVTNPPVTQPPVTQPPVTQPPVTQPPVTQPPVTQPPVTQPPVTQPPVTQPPVTQPPVTQPPVTQPPVTQPPVTQPPVTQPPVTQPPVTQPPVTQPPVSQPGASEGTQTSTPSSTPATKPAQPAPMATNPVERPTLPKEDNTATVVIIIVAVVIALLGGGAAVWFFVIKPKVGVAPAEEGIPDTAPAAEMSEEAPTEEASAEETPTEPTEENE